MLFLPPGKFTTSDEIAQFFFPLEDEIKDERCDFPNHSNNGDAPPPKTGPWKIEFLKIEIKEKR